MRKILCASVLMLALCGSTLAGDVHSPPAPSVIGTPSPFQTSGVQTAESEDSAAEGVIYGDGVDGITAAAFAALNYVLALL